MPIRKHGFRRHHTGYGIFVSKLVTLVSFPFSTGLFNSSSTYSLDFELILHNFKNTYFDSSLLISFSCNSCTTLPHLYTGSLCFCTFTFFLIWMKTPQTIDLNELVKFLKLEFTSTIEEVLLENLRRRDEMFILLFQKWHAGFMSHVYHLY